MADGVHNIAKGRVNEFQRRINANDPANSVFVLYLLVSPSEADGTLEDYDTLSALLAGSNTEAAFTNYARIVLDDTDVADPTVDNTGNSQFSDFADPVWSSAGGASNETLDKLGVGYDSDSTGGTDANIVPCTHHDFDITTNGGDITGQVAAGGFFDAA